MLVQSYYSRHTRQRLQVVFVLSLSALLTTALLPFLLPKSATPITHVREKVHTAALPLSFEPNVGQAESSVHYVGHAPGGLLLFEPSKVIIALNLAGADARKTFPGDAVASSTNRSTGKVVDSHIVSLEFVGAAPAPAMESMQALPGKVNYLRGNNRSKWHTNVPTYSGINYQALYPGVDLMYSGSEGDLKGTYTIAAGADPSRIRWHYGGARSTTLDAAGNLQISLDKPSTGDRAANLSLTEHAPLAWQEVQGRQVPVSVGYRVDRDGNIGFELGTYDHSKMLTIDPTITYSTYLGGFYGDGAGDIARDTDGNIYVTGATNSSDFPTTSGAFQRVWGGQSDAFVAKLSADGSTLLYSTFLGGEGQIDGGDFGQSISVDAAGNAIIGGSTDSEDFPTTPDAYQIIFGGSGDLFMSKLNADGSDLIFSTYYGDWGVEEGADFAVNAAGDTYFTGYFWGGLNSYALLGELSADGSQLLFVRSLGGHIPGPGDENANTHGRGITLDAAGNIYLTGDTRAADFPTTPGAYRTSIEAFEDGFVTKLTPSGQTLLYSTYIPGGVSDYPFDIALDPAGNAYITGNTSSGDYPTTPGAFDTTYGSGRDSFVTKLNPSGSALVYSTFLSGVAFAFDHNEDYGFGIRVDASGSAYVVGYTESPDFPVFNAIQPTLSGPYDAFVTKFNAAGSAVDYSTFLGGSSGDVASGIVLDGNGNAYICGSTSSMDFPTVNPVQPTNHGGSDVFIVRIFDPSGVSTPTPTRTGTPPTATRTATPTPCSPDANYSFRRYTGATLVPGTTDTGNHCDDCTTTVALPFSVRFYGQGYSSANLSSNGNIQFVSNSIDPYDYDSCEVAFPFLNYAAMPYFSDLDTADGGIFTSISGTAPNRIFNIEWRACVFDPIKFQCDDTVNFEARLYEGSPTEQIDFVYAQLDRYNGIPSVVAVQEGSGSHYRQFSCLQDVLQPGLLLTFFRNTCSSPTATLTRTPTRTGTPPTATPTTNPCGGLVPWRTETPMPIPHSSSAAAVLNNQLYVIGGGSNSPTPVRYTQKYDLASNSWSNKAAYPDGLGLAYSQAAVVNGKIYTIGDTYQPSESFVEMYDPVSDSWSRKATLPEPLLSGAVTAYAGKIYVIGGQVPGGFPSAHVYEYNPVADTFTAKAPMPTGQAEIGAAAIGGRIYAVGGYQYIHYAYDPEANSWSTIATPLTPSFSVPGVFAFNGEVWVIGGRDNAARRGYPPSQEVQIYNPATNTWHFGPALNNPRYYSTAVGVIGGRGYVVGGIDLPSETYPYDFLGSMESIAYLPCGTTTPTVVVGTVTRTPTRASTAIVSPTRTATAQASASATANASTATPTTCPMTFGDVQPADFFYTAVRYLYCAGVISGYSDGTFRPFNNTTRGQISKIVVLAEGWAIYTPPNPTFTDVPTTNPFYAFVETAYYRSIISGYSDGTFRPGNNVTRGQLSKIVVLAEQWAIYTPPTPTFRDVSADQPFYPFIETAYNHGIISGYSCGAGCLEFRPATSATRGQISKIVYQAVTAP